MRLINSKSLQFEEFEGSDIPKYAILSHRWQKEEVLFKDIEHGTASKKNGYHKFLKLCQLAEQDGIEYAWMDTCCIDKTSSAELSEAINSMYKWYQNAQIAYAYLYDVTSIHQFHSDSHSKWGGHGGPATRGGSAPFDSKFLQDFYFSEWFTRSWTLQELIAPSVMKFYNSDWQIIGTKLSLCGALSYATSIPSKLIKNESVLDDYAIAQRMSWAAQRKATRVEDIAYSLMGIFDVNMPMLYGEGEKAFFRLQEEILKVSEDDSILLFTAKNMGMLARCPSDFSCHLQPIDHDLRLDVKPFGEFDTAGLKRGVSKTPGMISISPAGLTFRHRLFRWSYNIYLVELSTTRGRGHPYQAHIFVQFDEETNRFHRIHLQEETIKWIKSRDNWEENAFPRSVILGDQQLISRSAPLLSKAPYFVVPKPKTILNKLGIRTVIHYETQLKSPFMVNLTSGCVISRLCFTTWGSTITVIAGACEVQAVLHVTKDNKTFCLYLGFDRCGIPHVVRKRWHLKRASFVQVQNDMRGDGRKSLVEHALHYPHFIQTIESDYLDPDIETVVRWDPKLRSEGGFETGIPGLKVSIKQNQDGCFYTFRDSDEMEIANFSPPA